MSGCFALWALPAVTRWRPATALSGRPEISCVMCASAPAAVRRVSPREGEAVRARDVVPGVTPPVRGAQWPVARRRGAARVTPFRLPGPSTAQAVRSTFGDPDKGGCARTTRRPDRQSGWRTDTRQSKFRAAALQVVSGGKPDRTRGTDGGNSDGRTGSGHTDTLWRSGALALWRSGALALWRSGALALWRSGALALWRSGALALWRSGALALNYTRGPIHGCQHLNPSARHTEDYCPGRCGLVNPALAPGDIP